MLRKLSSELPLASINQDIWVNMLIPSDMHEPETCVITGLGDLSHVRSQANIRIHVSQQEFR